MITSITEFSRTILREFPFRFPSVLLGAVVANVLEGIGVALLSPLFSLVSATTPEQGTIAAGMHRVAQAAGVELSLGFVLTTLLAIFMLQSALAIINEHVIHSVRHVYARRLRERVFTALFN